MIFAHGFSRWDNIRFKLNLASGLFRERAARRLALALRRFVGRHTGLGLVFVCLWFLTFLIAFLSLRHAILLIKSANAWALVSQLFLGCAFTETESSELAEAVQKSIESPAELVGLN